MKHSILTFPKRKIPTLVSDGEIRHIESSDSETERITALIGEKTFATEIFNKAHYEKVIAARRTSNEAG